MRVISGAAKGRILKAPKGLATRPTTDKVKEAVFSVLADLVCDAVVLDAYAGSGALAIEALSRGAKNAVLCDKSRAAAAVIRDNLTKSGLVEKTKFFNLPVEKVLSENLAANFNLVFLDPPYNTGHIAVIEELLLQPGVLSIDAIVVLETAADKEELFVSDKWRLLKKSRYGETAVVYYGLVAYDQTQAE